MDRIKLTLGWVSFLTPLFYASVVFSAQSFSCSFGKQPSCLDYGDNVCSSYNQCVSGDAAVFDRYQCNFEGFTCKSNVLN